MTLPEYVEAAVKSTNEPLPKGLEEIYRIIENHKGEFAPDSSYEIEAAILRICDKLDRFEKGKSDARSKCEKSMKVIRCAIPALPEPFLATYEKLFDALSASAAKKSE